MTGEERIVPDEVRALRVMEAVGGIADERGVQHGDAVLIGSLEGGDRLRRHLLRGEGYG